MTDQNQRLDQVAEELGYVRAEPCRTYEWDYKQSRKESHPDWPIFNRIALNKQGELWASGPVEHMLKFVEAMREVRE